MLSKPSTSIPRESPSSPREDGRENSDHDSEYTYDDIDFVVCRETSDDEELW